MAEENNYDQITLLLRPKGKKQNIINHAAKNGETLNEFINRAINETTLREDGLVLIGSGEITVEVELDEPVEADDENTTNA